MVDLTILKKFLSRKKNNKSAFHCKEKSSIAPPRSLELMFFARPPFAFLLLKLLSSNSYFLTRIYVHFCNCRIPAFFLCVLRFQYLVNSVTTVMEKSSCPYSEIPESRIELRQLPAQSVPCGPSLCPLSHSQCYHQGRCIVAPSPLPPTANPLSPAHFCD